MKPALILLITLLAGCTTQARTRIDLQRGIYDSTRNSDMAGVKIHVERRADGSTLTTMEFGKAGGDASTVNESLAEAFAAQAGIVSQLIEAGAVR